jgi:hypothetical protein
MTKVNDLHPQCFIDEKGEKTSVILPISEFEELIEDIQDLAVVAERREEPMPLLKSYSFFMAAFHSLAVLI